jgi:hypothetical protein
MLISGFAYSLSLKMEAKFSPDTSVASLWTIKRIAKDEILQGGYSINILKYIILKTGFVYFIFFKMIPESSVSIMMG